MKEINKLRIKEWAEEDRPREKMLLKGASVLTDAELLAILIGSGNNNETAVELSQRILHKAENNLNLLGKLSINDLITNFKGIGSAKAVTISAAMELGKRRSKSIQLQRESICSSAKVYSLLHPILCDLPYEELWIVLLNQSSKIIDKIKISQGGVSETSADIRLILKATISSLATSVIVCHNHPSGNNQPSIQDDVFTQKLSQSCKLIGSVLADHIILCDGSYYSYADEGKMR